MKDENDTNVQNNERKIKEFNTKNKVIIIIIIVLLVTLVFGLCFAINNSLNNKQDEVLDKEKKNDKDDSDISGVSFDLPEDCNKNNLDCVSVSTDNDLGKTFNGGVLPKVDTLEKAKEYVGDLVVGALVGVGADNTYSDTSTSSISDLYRLAVTRLGAYNYYSGVYKGYLCFEKNYLKNKVYEFYDVKVNDDNVSWEGMGNENYICSAPGMGAGNPGPAKQISEEYNVLNDSHVWKYTFGYDGSELQRIITIELKNIDGIYKLKSLKVE